MNSKTLYYILLGTVGLLAIATVGVGYGANALLVSKAAELNQAKLDGKAVEEQRAAFKQNSIDLKKYAELNKIAQAVVPQDKDQSQTVLEIIKNAQDSGITNLSSITFPASTLGDKTAKAGAPTQLMPIKDVPGVYALPITVSQESSSAVPYARFLEFLNKLEYNRRTAQVNTINIQPDKTDRSKVSFTLILNEYIKP